MLPFIDQNSCGVGDEYIYRGIFGPGCCESDASCRIEWPAHTIDQFRLFLEHVAALGRDFLFSDCRLAQLKRSELVDIYLPTCEWTRIYFGWQPNLPGESDNRLVELAASGSAHYLVTRDLRDFAAPELRFHGLRIVSPENFLKGVPP